MEAPEKYPCIASCASSWRLPRLFGDDTHAAVARPRWVCEHGLDTESVVGPSTCAQTRTQEKAKARPCPLVNVKSAKTSLYCGSSRVLTRKHYMVTCSCNIPAQTKQTKHTCCTTTEHVAQISTSHTISSGSVPKHFPAKTSFRPPGWIRVAGSQQVCEAATGFGGRGFSTARRLMLERTSNVACETSSAMCVWHTCLLARLPRVSLLTAASCGHGKPQHVPASRDT